MSSRVVVTQAAKWRGSSFGLNPTKLLVPDKVVFDGERVEVTKARLLGLFRSRQGAGVREIADVSLDQGLFNSTLTVVVRGRTNLEIRFLPKEQAVMMQRAILDALGGGGMVVPAMSPC